MWPNQKQYDGEWQEGKQHGKGKFTNSKGQSRWGIWENGQRIKWITPDGDTIDATSPARDSQQNEAAQ